MSNKKKPAQKSKGGKTADDNDDWEAILAAETQANESLKQIAPEPTPDAKAEPGGDDDEDDDDDDAAPGAKKVFGVVLVSLFHQH
jgi:hypothetical protein